MLNTSISILSRKELKLSDLVPVGDVSQFNAVLSEACQNLGACPFLLSIEDTTHTAALKLNKIYDLRAVRWSDVRKVAEAIEALAQSDKAFTGPALITQLNERWSISKAKDTEGYNRLALVDVNHAVRKNISECGGGYCMRSAALGHWLELFLKSDQGQKHLEHLAQNVKKLIWSQGETNCSSQDHIILKQLPYALTMYQHKERLQNVYDSFEHKQTALSRCADEVYFLIKNTKSFGIGRGYGVDAVQLVANLAGLEIVAQGKLFKRKGYQTTHHNIYSLI